MHWWIKYVIFVKICSYSFGFPSSEERQCGTIFCCCCCCTCVNWTDTDTSFNGKCYCSGCEHYTLCVCVCMSILKEEIRKFFDFSCKIRDLCLCLRYCHNFVDEQFVIDIYIPTRVFLSMLGTFVDVMWWVIVQSPSSIFAHTYIVFRFCLLLFTQCVFKCDEDDDQFKFMIWCTIRTLSRVSVLCVVFLSFFFGLCFLFVQGCWNMSRAYKRTPGNRREIRNFQETCSE